MKNDLSCSKDLENLSEEELLKIEEELTQKLAQIINLANTRANKLLEPYGMRATMAWNLDNK